jgi:hypothetical protein
MNAGSRVFYRAGFNSYDGILSMANIAIDSDPRYGPAYYFRGIVHKRRGDVFLYRAKPDQVKEGLRHYELARDDYARAIELDKEPTAEVYFQLGLTLERLRAAGSKKVRLDSIIDVFRKAQVRDPRSHRIQAHLAWALDSRHRELVHRLFRQAPEPTRILLDFIAKVRPVDRPGGVQDNPIPRVLGNRAGDVPDRRIQARLAWALDQSRHRAEKRLHRIQARLAWVLKMLERPIYNEESRRLYRQVAERMIHLHATQVVRDPAEETPIYKPGAVSPFVAALHPGEPLDMEVTAAWYKDYREAIASAARYDQESAIRHYIVAMRAESEIGAKTSVGGLPLPSSQSPGPESGQGAPQGSGLSRQLPPANDPASEPPPLPREAYEPSSSMPVEVATSEISPPLPREAYEPSSPIMESDVAMRTQPLVSSAAYGIVAPQVTGSSHGQSSDAASMLTSPAAPPGQGPLPPNPYDRRIDFVDDRRDPLDQLTWHHSSRTDFYTGLLDDNGVLNRWRVARHEAARVPRPEAPKLVIVAVSGGGIVAAGWTVRCLTEIERQFPDFPYHVRVITGASGGMVGAGLYVASLGAPPPEGTYRTCEDLKQLRRQIDQDSLTPVVRRLVLRDLPSIFSPAVQSEDRGRVLERRWHENTGGALTKSFFDLRGGELAGWRPSLIVSPLVVEDGAQVAISNLDLEHLGGINMHFFSTFPLARATLPLSTALRMNAAFPFASPAVSLPTDPPRRVADAGYVDNYGIQLAAEWIRAHERWLAAHTSGVALVQIRAYKLNLPGKESGSGWSSLAPALHWLTSPLEGYTAAKKTAMVTLNDRLVTQLLTPADSTELTAC